ncbi:hypothetical protein INS49_002677 [Diaporthe citri]|uniref:uncharacterized protein n=1 Tax=Diaporthe citri TaxID=83186 RepID=UPI001C7EB61A|nr:uncharacterized protein INS49_002677 [Diaporthe citri]KAG6368470.1 hypothetical protein INS49_002677 [Diaporthe citri]
MADPITLVEQLRLLVESPDAFQADEAQKQELLKLSRQAAAALESPFETLQRLVYSPLPLVVARICQDRRIFATLAANESVTGVSSATLITASALQPSVLDSIMDYACVQGMAAEVSQGQYLATKLTHTLLVPVFVDGVTHFHDNCLPGFTALHRALTEGDGRSNAFKLGQNTSEDFYTWMDTHPVQQRAFHSFMKEQFASLPTWLDVVSFAAEFAQDSQPDDVVFVDVGGGNGSQCAALKRSLPELRSRVVLQDHSYVLEKALEVEGMEKMPYDFFMEQPVKGARVYYFRQIIHNFDDVACVRILESQVPALGPDNVIVIDDKVLSDNKPPAGTPGIEYTAALNIAMKVMFDAQERRETHWRRLLDQAGLRIKDIRKYTRFDDAVIIAARKLQLG